MRTSMTIRIAAFVLLLPLSALAQVGNVADILARSKNYTVLVPGELATIWNYGSELFAATATVRLRPSGQESTVSARVVEANGARITFLVPQVPVGFAQLIWETEGNSSEWSRVEIVPSDLALLRTGNTGPLRAQNISPSGKLATHGLASPAQPGDSVVLWATGLGSAPPDSVKVLLGGVAQAILFAGPAPGQPGVEQINFRVSSPVTEGCYVPLTVQTPARTSDSFLSITANGQPCRHPLLLSDSSLSRLDAGDLLPLSLLKFSTALDAASADKTFREETIGFYSYRVAADWLAELYFISPLAAGSSCTAIPVPVIGIGISLVLVPGQSPIFTGTPRFLGEVRPLNAPATSVTDPPATILSADAPLSRPGVPLVQGGSWTWTPATSDTTGVSSFDFRLPPPVTLSGGSPVRLRRDRDQQIVWNAVDVPVGFAAKLAIYDRRGGRKVIECNISAMQGSVTLPAPLMAGLQPGQGASMTLEVTGTITATPHSGSGMATAISWRSSDTRPMDVQ